MNGKAADPDVELLVLCRLLGEADRSDLREAIGAAGDEQLVHRMRMQALDRLDADHAFMLGLVREHRRPRDVADGVDAGHIGPAHAVDHDGAAIGLHAELFETEILDIADDADRRNHPVDGHRLRAALAVVDGRGDAVGLLVELRHLGAGEDLDALFLELLAREGRDLGILRPAGSAAAPRPRSPRRPWCDRSSRTRCRWRRSRPPAATSASCRGPSPRNRSRPASCPARARAARAAARRSR